MQIQLLPAALISLTETGRRKQEVTLSLAKEISVDGSFIRTGRLGGQHVFTVLPTLFGKSLVRQCVTLRLATRR